MKINFFQFCILSLIISIVSSNSNAKSAQGSNKSAIETPNSKSKELDISEDFSTEVYFRLGIHIEIFLFPQNTKSLFNLDKIDSEWYKRGVIEFISKINSKNNKAAVKITNENTDKSVYGKIRKECELKGTYYVRLSIGTGFLYSSMRAVLFNI